MALLVHELGLLFIMAPHTGCTAVGEVLRTRFGAVWIPSDDLLAPDGSVVVPRKHSRLRQLMEAGLLTPQERARLVVAASVRNPFDEQVSHFKQREHRRPKYRGASQDGTGRPALAEIDLETWLRRRYVGRPWARLVGWEPKRPVDFTEGVDVVLRFERLQADVDALMGNLGVTEPVEIPFVNETGARKKRPYQEFYTPRARQIVEGVFADRIAKHGYAWESLDASSAP